MVLVVLGCFHQPSTMATTPAALNSCFFPQGERDQASLPSNWLIGPDPLLHIDANSVQGRTLGSVSVALRRRDASIVTASGSPSHLLIFAADGSLTQSVRVPIEAPYTTANISWLGLLSPDTIVAFEMRQAKLFMVASGAIVGSSQIERREDLRCPSIVGMFEDRSLLVSDACIPGPVPEGLSRATRTYARFALTGQYLGTVAELAGSEIYRADGRFGPFPFGRSPVAAVNGSVFYYGTSDTFEIGVHSMTGERRDQLCFRRENRLLTAEDIVRERNARLAALAAARGARTDSSRALEANTTFPVPKTMPAYSGLLVDADGNAWIESYRYDEEQASEWIVFNRAGAVVARTEMPRGFVALAIDDGHVVGRFTDESGRRHLRVHSLIKP
jgi:hypothetical protein